MYNLIHHVQDGLVELRNILEAYITSQGLAALEKWHDESGANTGTEKEDANAYVSAILRVHSKYEALVKGAFQNDAGSVIQNK
jgi:cullin 1